LLNALVNAVLSDSGATEMIIVVDGLDDVASVVEANRLGSTHPRVRSVAVDQQGQMGALDQGVLVAQGDLILLLDDDVLPTTPLATGHARRHGARDDLVVVGAMPVRSMDGVRLGVASRIYASAYDGHCAELARGDEPVLNSLWMGNVSLRREWCLKVGVRSSAYGYPYHADRDFGYRLADAGLTGAFDPSLRAVHLHSRSNQAFLGDAARQGSGLRLLHEVHPDRLGPFTPTMLTKDLPRPLDTIFRGVVSTSRTRQVTARALMALGGLAGRLHVNSAETYLAKAAQHIMQWHGAVVVETG
jgi:hypothetical protein